MLHWSQNNPIGGYFTPMGVPLHTRQAAAIPTDWLNTIDDKQKRARRVLLMFNPFRYSGTYRATLEVGVLLQHFQLGSSVSLPPILIPARSAAARAAATKDSTETVGSLAMAELHKTGL
jgi:hypothetical protein